MVPLLQLHRVGAVGDDTPQKDVISKGRRRLAGAEQLSSVFPILQGDFPCCLR